VKREICTIDAETDPFRVGRVPQPFVWGWYNGVEYREFAETEALADFLRPRRSICYAHNGGKFDFHYLLPFLTPYSQPLIINDRIVSARMLECELRDSYAILPIRLADYKKEDIDYAILEPLERVKPENKARISAYLKADCVYLHQLVSRFIDQFGLRMTVAGAAMAVWNKLSGRMPPTTGAFYDDLHPFYYGGRVECFETGVIDQNFSVYDINSAYPWAMLSDHPTGAAYTESTYSPSADFFELECDSLGAFPLRGFGGLSFPADGERRRFFVTRHEVEAAEDTDTLHNPQFHTSIRFSRRQNFTRYVDYFFEKKLEAKRSGDSAGYLLAKLFLVSLSGKFAANPDKYENFRLIPADELAAFSDHETWSIAGQIGCWGLVSKPLEEEAKRFYNVATGASITGQVRALLWRTIRASDGVLYCDTDSVAVRRFSEGAEIGEELGQWKHEGDFYQAGIAGKKLYCFKGLGDTPDKIASKGVRLTGDEIMRIAAGESVEYAQEAPSFSIKKAPGFIKRKITRTVKPDNILLGMNE